MDVNAKAARSSGGLEILVAIACGAVVANLYFAQPIIGEIATSLGLPLERAGLVVTLTQLGYCCGLLLLVPLGDLLENRRLALGVLVVGVLSALVLATATSPLIFLAACFGLGIGSVSVQILLPFVAALADPGRQGVAVGRVMAGILTGIMLSRPVSSLFSDLFGWRSIFVLAAMSTIAAAVAIRQSMPPRVPSIATSYGAILRSMAYFARHNRLLQRRAAYQFLMFYSYTVLWTALPLVLLGPDYSLTHGQVALFALAGAAGALMSPVAGRVADRGLIVPGTTIALALGLCSWLIGGLGLVGGYLGLASLLIAAIALDAAVPLSLVMSQRELFAMHPNERGRLNGLFMAAFFTGGAIGAGVGTWALASGGWAGVAVAGAMGPGLALVLHLVAKPTRQSVSQGEQCR